MSQKAAWLVVPALILVVAALFLIVRVDESGLPAEGESLRELQTPQPGERMVAEGGQAPVTGTPERQQLETPPPAASDQVVVRGRLVDAESGAPVADRQLEMGVGQRLPGGQLATATSGPDGSFSYRVQMGQGGVVRLVDPAWVLEQGLATFQGSRTDIDLGNLSVVAASVVAGVVLDPGGQPVAGVEVRAGQGRIMGFGEGARRQTTSTDDQGRFRIGGLRAGDYNLRTASPAFLPKVEDVALRVGERREDLVLQLQRGQAIAGQVVDDIGRPVAGINVGSRRRSTPSAGVTMERFTPGEATVTDENGLFTLAGLEGDETAVRAWGQGYAEAMESDVAIGTSNLVLQVERLGVIEGTLVNDQGNPVAGSRVRASVGRGGNGALTMEMVAPGRVSSSGMATTQEDGSFRIEGVRPGNLTVRATGDGHRPVEQTGVRMAPGGHVDGVRLVARLGTSLVVQVVDSDGAPVAEANVQVIAIPDRQEAMPAGPGRRVISRDVRIEERDGERVVIDGRGEEVVGTGRTDAEGMVTIGGLRVGNFHVKATHTELITPQPKAVMLPGSGTVETQLAMGPGGFADLKLLDADGQPMSNARYMVVGPASQLEPGEHDGRSDGAGAARVGPLAPGTYIANLQLQPPGRSVGPGIFVSMAGGMRNLDESRIQFDVRANEITDVELIKPVLTNFTGTVFDASGPVAGATVQLRRKSQDAGGPGGLPSLPLGGTYMATSESDGSFAIEDLSAGIYTVTYGRPTQLVKAEMEVDFAAGQPEARQDLRLTGGTLRVTVMSEDQGGPLAGARVEVVRPSAAGEERREVYMMAVRAEPGGGGGGETMTMEMGGSTVVTDAAGVAVIEAVPPGEYSLRINHATHVEQLVSGQRVTDGAVTDAGVASLALGGTISVEVTSDLSEVMIVLVEYRPSEGGEPEQVTARQGKLRLEGLKPGKYRVRARDLLLTRRGTTARWSTEREVEVTAGQVKNLTLGLPVPH